MQYCYFTNPWTCPYSLNSFYASSTVRDAVTAKSKSHIATAISEVLDFSFAAEDWLDSSKNQVVLRRTHRNVAAINHCHLKLESFIQNPLNLLQPRLQEGALPPSFRIFPLPLSILID